MTVPPCRLRDAVVVIVGLGQIGASLGRALVARRACRRVIGVARRAATLRTAARLRAAHETSRRLRAACARADLIVLATPVRTILRLLPVVAAAVRPGTLLLDAGSTKVEVLRAARAALQGRSLAFVGGHPLAGSEGRGPASSDAGLFVGRPFVLVAPVRTPRSALATARALVRAIGGRPVPLGAAEHDALVAEISHLPHAVAVALALEAAGFRHGRALALAAGSFRGATRVAASDTDLLLDILLTNRQPVAAAISRLVAALHGLRRAVAAGDEARLRGLLAAARRVRRSLDT